MTEMKAYNRTLLSAHSKSKKKMTREESTVELLTDTNEHNSEKTMRNIIFMNLSTQEYKVYSINGVMLRIVNFEKQSKNYGRPIAASQNGQSLVFFQPVTRDR